MNYLVIVVYLGVIKMNDRRNLKTEKLIKDVFLNLLKTKDINKISVAEISRIADVGRGTFYLHYQDVYDLYESIELEVITDLKNMFKASFPTTNSTNSLKLSNSLVTYIENNKDLFKILIRSNIGNTMNKIKRSFYNDVFDENSLVYPSINKQYSLLESIFVVSGIIGTLEKWILDDFKVSGENMAKMINTIILKINNN